MTKLQEQIVEKKAAIESKKMYGVPPLTLRKLKDELKELYKAEIASYGDTGKYGIDGGTRRGFKGTTR